MATTGSDDVWMLTRPAGPAGEAGAEGGQGYCEDYRATSQLTYRYIFTCSNDGSIWAQSGAIFNQCKNAYHKRTVM